MLHQSFNEFFVASVGAAAAFIGLLFVALTVSAARPDTQGISRKDQFLAESSYTALVNVLFVSFVALIPNTNFAWVFLALGLSSAFASASRIFAQRKTTNHPPRQIISAAWLVGIYILEAVYGSYLIFSPAVFINEGVLITIVFTLYATALERAWALNGFDHPARRSKSIDK
jgi:hypothetical protein